MRNIKQNFKIDTGNDFNKIWKWSVDNTEIFWKSIWDFTKVKGILGKNLLQKSNIFYNNKFFPDTKLSYAENLLKKNIFGNTLLMKACTTNNLYIVNHLLNIKSDVNMKNKSKNTAYLAHQKTVMKKY